MSAAPGIALVCVCVEERAGGGGSAVFRAAGTQIEPAAPKHTNMFTASNRICGKLLKGLGLPNEYAYPGYYNDPSLYIRITHEFASHPERTSL